VKRIELEPEESELLEAYEAGVLRESKSSTDFAAVARNTLAKSHRVNIRLSEMDVVSLQRRAAREGIPPQTLMGSILHKYATGQLRERAA